MLSEKYIKYDLKVYCRDDITKIEGFERAMADKSNTVYCCHHRLETHFEDGSLRPKPLEAELLKELGYYEQRPASELVILTVREHLQLHELARGHKTYENTEIAREAHVEQGKERQKRHPNECRRYSKVYKWAKRNPNSTSFPEGWSQEDIETFYKLK